MLIQDISSGSNNFYMVPFWLFYIEFILVESSENLFCKSLVFIQWMCLCLWDKTLFWTSFIYKIVLRPPIHVDTDRSVYQYVCQCSLSIGIITIFITFLQLWALIIWKEKKTTFEKSDISFLTNLKKKDWFPMESA